MFARSSLSCFLFQAFLHRRWHECEGVYLVVREGLPFATAITRLRFLDLLFDMRFIVVENVSFSFFFVVVCKVVYRQETVYRVCLHVSSFVILRPVKLIELSKKPQVRSCQDVLFRVAKVFAYVFHLFDGF